MSGHCEIIDGVFLVPRNEKHRTLDGHLMIVDKTFVEQSMVYRPAFVEHCAGIYFCAQNETSNIWRAFDDHHSHEGQAVVEHLTDKDRPLLRLLVGN